MSEKCFCHLIVDGVAYKVKDADARKSIEEIIKKIENDVDQKYVDDMLLLKVTRGATGSTVYAISETGQDVLLPYDPHVTPNTIPIRDKFGTFKVVDPIELYNPVTLNYLKNNYVSISTYQTLQEQFVELTERVVNLEGSVGSSTYTIYLDAYSYDKYGVDLHIVVTNGTCGELLNVNGSWEMTVTAGATVALTSTDSFNVVYDGLADLGYYDTELWEQNPITIPAISADLYIEVK